MEKKRCRVAFQGVVDELGRLFGDLQLRGDANLDARPVVEIDFAELEMQFLGVTRIDVRLDDQLLALLPLARDRRDESTFRAAWLSGSK